MNCTYVKDALYEYIYGELDHNHSMEIAKHLEDCQYCREEYLELKSLLIDFPADITTYTNSISIPEDTISKINNVLDSKTSKKNTLFSSSLVKFSTAACIAFIILFTTPAMGYLIQLPAISKYLDLDKNIVTEFNEGKGQLIGKSDSMKDITFTVDAIIRKKDKTLILFTTKLDSQNHSINFAHPSTIHNAITVEDQFGYKYQLNSGSITVKSVNEDGEAKCIFEIPPLKPWAYKLDIKVTAMNLGYYNNKENNTNSKEIKNYGLWDISFYIKPIKE